MDKVSLTENIIKTTKNIMAAGNKGNKSITSPGNSKYYEECSRILSEAKQKIETYSKRGDK